MMLGAIIAIIVAVTILIIIAGAIYGGYLLISGAAYFKPRVVGYWTNWTNWLKVTPEDTASMAGCTHCIYSFITLASINDHDNPTTDPWNGNNLYANTIPLFVNTNTTIEDPTNPPLDLEGNDEAMGSIHQMETFIKIVQANQKKAYLAIGGWSDTQSTPKFTNGLASANKMTNMLKKLLIHTGADGIDFDWEHLGSWYNSSGNITHPSLEDKVDRCLFLGYLMKLMYNAGITLAYTTRSNAFVPYQYMYDTTKVTGSSDLEGLFISIGGEYNGDGSPESLTKYRNDALAQYSNALLPGYTAPKFTPKFEYMAMMTYDGAVGVIANANEAVNGVDLASYGVQSVTSRTALDNQYGFEEIKQVVDDNQRVSGLNNKQIVTGFEPVIQAAGGVPMTTETGTEVAKWIFDENRGGCIIWAINGNTNDGAQGRMSAEIAKLLYTKFTGKPAPVMKHLGMYSYTRDWGYGAGEICGEHMPYNYDTTRGVFWNNRCA
jgi:hypothetical protein